MIKYSYDPSDNILHLTPREVVVLDNLKAESARNKRGRSTYFIEGDDPVHGEAVILWYSDIAALYLEPPSQNLFRGRSGVVWGYDYQAFFRIPIVQGLYHGLVCRRNFPPADKSLRDDEFMVNEISWWWQNEEVTEEEYGAKCLEKAIREDL